MSLLPQMRLRPLLDDEHSADVRHRVGRTRDEEPRVVERAIEAERHEPNSKRIRREQIHRRARRWRGRTVDRGFHQMIRGFEIQSITRAAPSWSGATRLRDLPLPLTGGKRRDVDLALAGLGGHVREKLAV